MSIFLTSDTHFNHTNIIKYCPDSRGKFNDIQEMNETLISNWNNKVSKNDTVYHLGDFGFGNVYELITILIRLNGHKILCAGNHDVRYLNKEFVDFWNLVIKPGYTTEKINKTSYVLSHFPLFSWDRQYYSVKHFHGHSHGSVIYSKNAFDVGVDGRPNNDLTPWELSELTEYMDKTEISERISRNHSIKSMIGLTQ